MYIHKLHVSGQTRDWYVSCQDCVALSLSLPYFQLTGKILPKKPTASICLVSKDISMFPFGYRWKIAKRRSHVNNLLIIETFCFCCRKRIMIPFHDKRNREESLAQNTSKNLDVVLWIESQEIHIFRKTIHIVPVKLNIVHAIKTYR